VRDDGKGISQQSLHSLARRDIVGNSNELCLLNQLARVSIVSKCRLEPCYYLNQSTVSLQDDDHESSQHKLGCLVRSWFQPYPFSGVIPEFVTDPIHDSGSIVVVQDLFQMIPVRRNLIQTEHQHDRIEKLKIDLLNTLANHLDVKLQIMQYAKITNTFTDLLKIVSPKSVHSLLDQIFGKGFVPEVENVHALSTKFSLSGVICKQSFHSTKYQFLLLDDEILDLSIDEKEKLRRLFKGSKFDSMRIKTYPLYVISITSKQGSGENQRHELFTLLCKTFISFLTSQNCDITISSLPHPIKEQVSPKKSPTKQTKPEHDIESRPTTPIFQFNMKEASIINLGNKQDIQIAKQDFVNGNFRVIKQLDNKFILAVIQVKLNPTLIAIDQHACDERILVETYFNETITHALDQLLGKSLQVPIHLSLSQLEYSLLVQYESNLNQFGIFFMSKNAEVLFTSLPILFHQLDEDELKSCILQHLYDLQSLKKSASTLGDNWWKNVRNLPELMIYLIKSKACRTAVKFGDVLSAYQMEQMLEKLGKCNLPFQCAHGRPTLIPLVDLQRYKEYICESQ
jgi:DNA mismatch repair protein MLH3